MTLFQTILNEDLAATEELLRHGSDPNLIQFNGASAFHIAVGIDNLELSEDLTKLILQYDGDPNVRSSEGATPVHTAAAFGHCENLRLLLLNGGDPFLVDQDGLDALANAKGSGCGLCCAIVRQHQQKLLDDLMRPTDTRAHYTITPYVPSEARPPCAFGSVTRQTTLDPFVSPPHDQLSVAKTSTQHPVCLHKPNTWCEEEETNAGHLFGEWQVGGGNGSNDIVSQGEPRLETEGVDRSRLEGSSSSTGSHESFYTCSDNGSVPVVYPLTHHSLRQSGEEAGVCGVTGQPDNDTHNHRALVGMEDGKSDSTGDDDSSLGCAFLGDNDKETGETITDESLTSSVSFQLPSEYYSSSSDDDDRGESSASSDRVAPPINEFARLHLNVGGTHRGCDRRDLSVINESQFTDDLRDEESRLMTEDETELEVDVAGCSDRYAVWSATDHWDYGDGTQRGLIPDSGVTFCSPDEKTMLDKFCRSRFDVTPRHDMAHGDNVTPRHDMAHGDNVTPRHDMAHGDNATSRQDISCSIDTTPKHDMDYDVNITPRHDMANNDSRSIFSPKSNARHLTEQTNTQLTPKGNKTRLWQCTRDTHGTHPQCLQNNPPSLAPHYRGGVSHGAGDGSSVCSDAPPVEHNRLEKRLFGGHKVEPPGAYPASDSSVISISSIDSHASLNSTVQYIYTDDEDGYSLLATRFLPDPASGKTIPPDDIPGDIQGLGDTELRSHLTSLGDTPGPITPSTRRLYQSRLSRLLKDPTLVNIQDVHCQEFLPELTRALTGQLDMSSMDGLEDLMSEPFVDPCASRRWREGTLKTSFNYLLMDPRVSQNLPARHRAMDEQEAFRTFVRAVFYVGKGKRSRPYAHFKEAIQHLSGVTGAQCGAKVQRIVDIWEEEQGVISLHVFQNVIPAEAYTREACIIEAVGLERLTNIKGGECYGPVVTWSRIQRRTLGVHLLHKAFRILLIEGERQIQPHHICVGQ